MNARAQTRRARILALALFVVLALVPSCRCSDEGPAAHKAAIPLLPSGMLAPPVSSSAARIGPSAFALAHTDARPPGEWIRLEATRDTANVYLPVPVMPLLHEAFARALPGFGPFGSHRFEGAALGRLHDEVEALGRGAGALSLAEARRRWPASDGLARIGGDSDWVPCREAFAQTLAELTVFLDAARRRGDAIRAAPSD
jgi:hypothetical protein